MNRCNGHGEYLRYEVEKPVAVPMAFVGCGGMARHHARQLLKQQETSRIVAVCEPSAAAYELFSTVFKEVGVAPPPNEPDFGRLLARYRHELEAAFIITPHAYHYRQARACLEAGLDVLLEKPMVMSVDEAEDLMAVSQRTERLLVVAFNGSLSPQIRTAVHLLGSGNLGQLLTVSATVWQGWQQTTANTWRQVPEIAGGGFLFDTGAHMLNTVADLVGEDFVEVAAFLENCGADVDILGAVIGRLKSGVLVTLHGCGNTITSCASDVRVFCSEGILRTGVWGERLFLQRAGEIEESAVPVPVSLGPWEQFLRVRSGEIPNPSPPEVGLRMARLWDAIKESASLHGQPVAVQTGLDRIASLVAA